MNNKSNNIKHIIDTLNATVNQVAIKMKDSSKVSREGYMEMDNITDILERINETSKLVEGFIKKQGKLIINISNEFDVVAKEVSDLYGLSEKNIGMVKNIKNNINDQNDSIYSIKSKMDGVESFAGEIAFME